MSMIVAGSALCMAAAVIPATAVAEPAPWMPGGPGPAGPGGPGAGPMGFAPNGPGMRPGPGLPPPPPLFPRICLPLLPCPPR